jgi:geranylgeranylglycerol-phosphate geranylgeranyltransferase
MIRFLKSYIKSMRLYYAFVTGIAGWIGVACYEYTAKSAIATVEVVPTFEKKVLMLVMLFLSWGINQIFNDYLGLKEDRINAPHRPMVTGELDPKKALMLSGFLLLVISTFTIVFLEPYAIIPAALGIVFNILYEYAKGYGWIGNIVFGMMISTCSVFGFMASGPLEKPYVTSDRISVILMVIVLNGVMTFYTYFKDYEGDKAAHKKTLVVKYGLEKAGVLALILAFLPGIFFVLLYSSGMLSMRLDNTFLALAILTFFLEIWTGFKYFKNQKGKNTYYSLSVNFRACSCGQAALVGLYDARLAAVLFIVTYILVEFLFGLHNDPDA